MAKVSAFEQVTRERLDQTQEEIRSLKVEFTAQFNKFDTRITDLFNHNSNKWPPAAAWTLTAFGTLLGAIVTGVIMNWIGA